MAELLVPGMTVIDAGAHVGVYSLLAARLVGSEGRVYAIEPQSDCLQFLKRNAAANGLPQLKAFSMALGNKDGVGGLAVNDRNMSAFLEVLGRCNDQEVDIRTLESFAKSERISQIDLLKVDAAGSEFAVIQGADSLFEEGRLENIICKLYHPSVIAERFGEPAVTAPWDLVAHLRSRGYVVVLSDGRSASDSALSDAFGQGSYSIPALAIKRRSRSRRE